MVLAIDHTSWSALCVHMLQQILCFNDPKLQMSVPFKITESQRGIHPSSASHGQMVYC